MDIFVVFHYRWICAATVGVALTFAQFAYCCKLLTREVERFLV